MSLASRLRFEPIRLRTLIKVDVQLFLQIFEICLLKSNLKLIVIPRSLTSSLQFILLPLRSNTMFCLWVLLPIAIAWNLSGLACILKANHDIRDLLSSSRDSITVSSVLSDFESVLSSA